MASLKLLFLFYFVRSGYISPDDGKFWNAGQWGFDWSSRGVDNIWGSAGLGSYSLGFDATDAYPLNGPSNRYNGVSLRCLSTVLDM